MLSFLSFALQSHDHSLKSPGGIGGQCVDLANEYLRVCYGLPHVFLNAVDWQHVTIGGWGWTLNTPRNFPEATSLVVWGENARDGIGPFGHIAVVASADLAHILSFDQNWPAGARCSWVEHDYAGVVGWHTPPSH